MCSIACSAMKYFPVVGAGSSLLFSTHVMQPGFLPIMSPARGEVFANCLWFNSHLGVGLYIYGRPHLAKFSTYNRIIFSVYGSVLYNFGMVLLWATIKENNVSNGFRVFAGLVTGVTGLMIGRKYFNMVEATDVEE